MRNTPLLLSKHTLSLGRYVMMKDRIVELFFLLAAVCVASNIYLLIPIYSELAEGLSITYDEAVFSSTIFTFCYATGLLCFGPISAAFSKRNVLFFGMIASCCLTLIITFSTSLTSFYLSRGLQGFVLGSFAPVAYAYCFDAFQVKRRTFIIAIINTGFLMAGIIGQLISSLTVNMLDWRAVFYFFGLSYLCLSLCAFFVLRNVSIQKKRNSADTFTTGKLFQAPIILGLSITFITLMSFVSIYEEFAQYYVELEKELFYSRCIALLGTPLSLFSSFWIKKYSLINILLTCIAIIISSFALMILTKQLIVITILSLFFVSAVAIFIPSLITFIGESAGDKRATAISLYSFTLLTGASIGPLVANLLPFQYVLLLFIVLFGMAFIFLLSYNKLTLNKK
ncbi:MFS transporter [Bacillus sp. AFS040349]|nr:MFS transporter [Bacillus sp. AFS040349]